MASGKGTQEASSMIPIFFLKEKSDLKQMEQNVKI